MNFIWENQFLFFFLLLAQYIVLMEFQTQLKVWARPLYIIFIVQDWVMNLIMTIWFLDLPEKWHEVVTERMKRYKKIELRRDDVGLIMLLNSWRHYFSVFLCRILSVFDKDHC